MCFEPYFLQKLEEAYQITTHKITTNSRAAGTYDCAYIEAKVPETEVRN
jgi:hypothetical protein